MSLASVLVATRLVSTRYLAFYRFLPSCSHAVRLQQLKACVKTSARNINDLTMEEFTVSLTKRYLHQLNLPWPLSICFVPHSKLTLVKRYYQGPELLRQLRTTR